MKTKRYFKTMILTLAVSGLCLQTLAGAQENSQSQPTYSSAAKVGQAAQVAKREANTKNPSLQAALTHLKDAEVQMDRMQMSGNQHQKMSAELSLNNAEDKYVGMLSQMSGVSEKDISDMHTTGVDWADFPSELGMPGMTGQMGDSAHESMGTGSIIDSRKAEIKAATARNTKSGSAKGHGTGMQTDVHGSGDTMSGAGGLGNGMGSGGMQDHDSGMSGGIGGGSGSGGGGGGGM
ncbi:MAG: hypothetical protein WBB23_22895 [Desulforhopalus sp.]